MVALLLFGCAIGFWKKFIGNAAYFLPTDEERESWGETDEEGW